MLRQILPLILLLLAGLNTASAQNLLPAQVNRVIQAHGMDPARVAIWVQPVNADKPWLAHNPDTALNPASVIKLATSLAALEVLGPAYTWKTRVHLGGPVEQGVLKGDLWLIGGGDPFLVTEEFWKLLGALRRQGIRRIEGDLVFDLSYFRLPDEEPAAFDGQPHRVYNQGPHPLLVNFNALHVEVVPDPDGDAVSAVVDPPIAGLQIDNRLRQRAGPCGGYRLGISYRVLEERTGIGLDGRFPGSCGPHRFARTALTPEAYVHGLFTSLWAQWGGEFEGGWRVDTWSDVEREPALVHESRPLGELIRLANKHSNNVMTRHFELTLGAETFGMPATPEKGLNAILDYLAARGIDSKGLVLDNAAGLSRHNRVTARQLAGILRAGRQSPFMPEFISSLALAGLDGTLRSRFEDDPAAGRMHLKTGFLEGVSSIAGYVKTATGEDVMVVVMANGPGVQWSTGIELQDAVLRWVFER
ncbi:D-alanyl-D-alanine carboxypeptidase/D-alanyl-D-alanine endopeptidase [Thioalkalivibrio sulfidiphilus]|uniref:D-alanyl-D-alanine carboxypeptidase/D-alanyl-D-alanine endopeptidase n=1 Tax=Thioalkalivibrio sulfidiphilus TaxID=1033854 RepID=UPI003B391BE1